MAFSNFKEIGQVQSEFNITRIQEFFIIANPVQPSEIFLRELDFTQTAIDYEASEAARSEAVIFPILREVYKSYADKFSLWIQKSIMFDEILCGTPDYLISAKSPLGKKVLETPLTAVVEAKKNDFEIGWGQCLAEMIALQKINRDDDKIIYGIVSDGRIWDFGKLHQKTFTLNQDSITIADLPKLFGALHFIFQAAAAEL